MKVSLKIIQLQNGKFSAKRKGLFGWKYLNEIYDGNWMWHYSWSYLFKPDGVGLNDIFDTKTETIQALSRYYHSRRGLKEKKIA